MQSQQQSQQQFSPIGAGTIPTGGLLDGYQPPPNVCDEYLDASGQGRAPWNRFLGSMKNVGTGELSHRWLQAQRLIHENGVAYGAYGDPLDTPRPWELDALPLLVDQQEWNAVSAGLLQRAQVLELVLADLYGERKLIRDGILPPETVYAHPGFHTVLHGLRPGLDRYLHFYAADLGRAPDGRWWLLGDRAESPSGAGYALENRVVTSRMLPEAFRACQVQRLDEYFMAIRENVRAMAPRHKDNPRVVLLSQGAQSENYFEDSYLSRHLGFTLVEGADLAVRDRAVWIKTLGGLYPVDVILRRPNTCDSDSLEIPTSSPSAIAGLVEALRAGNVAVTNPLGGGLIESPIFTAYMEPVCRALLGQDPLLPSAKTWWCGDPKSCDHVIQNIDKLVVLRAFRQRGEERKAVQELRQLTRQQLIERIRSNPVQYVGQESLLRSSMPHWNGGEVSTAHVALRAFMFAKKGSFEVMPGGLARTSKEVGSLDVSLVAGEGSKDTWILGNETPKSQSILPTRNGPVALRRSGDDLPSRVADDIYWLGRQIERADSAARLVRAVSTRLTGDGADTATPELPMLLRTMADQGQIEPGFVVQGMREQMPAIHESLPVSVFDVTVPGSLRSMLALTYNTASRVRDRLSLDSWRVLVRIEESFRAPTSGKCDMTELLNMSNELIANLAGFIGMISESMTRTQAFHFMDLGVRIERALQMTSLLSNCFTSGQAISGEVIESLLQVSDSLMTHRYRYLSNMHIVPVLDLLITDETNPRSILYQLMAIKEHIDQLPRTNPQALPAPEQKLLLSVLYAVRMLDIESIGMDPNVKVADQLSDVFERIEIALPGLSQTVTNKYMVHSGPARLLSPIGNIRMDKA